MVYKPGGIITSIRDNTRVLNDHFGTVGDGIVPDTNIWTLTEDNDASCLVQSSNILQCRAEIIAGTGNTEDCIMDASKRFMMYGNNGTTEIHFKTRFRVVDLTGEFAIGPTTHVALAASLYDNGNLGAAGIHGDNDLIHAVSDDNTVVQTTDISATIAADNTWYEFESIVTAASVIFLIDGATVATHVTRVPTLTVHGTGAAKNTNGITTALHAQYMEHWLV